MMTSEGVTVAAFKEFEAAKHVGFIVTLEGDVPKEGEEDNRTVSLAFHGPYNDLVTCLRVAARELHRAGENFCEESTSESRTVH
jgi:hypothetical protein